ncbi:MAG: thioredoxin domain-containing protein [Parcubacteria group bacterium]
MENNKHLIPLAIVLAGGMIAGAIYLGGGKGPTGSNGPDTKANNPVEMASPSADEHIRGDVNAPVVVVEYSDLECPFCKVFHNTMLEVMNSYDGQVAWVYRHFPIPQLHQKAIMEAEATECAAELGGNSAFWSYIDEVFERTNSNDSLDPAELPKIAGDIGLDVSAFNSCLSSGRHSEKVQKSAEEAVKAGARGTPYSIIVAGEERIVINGAEPITTVRAKIDSLLR